MTWFFGRLFLDENIRIGKVFIFTKNVFWLENAGNGDEFRQIPPENAGLEFLPEKSRGFYGRGRHKTIFSGSIPVKIDFLIFPSSTDRKMTSDSSQNCSQAKILKNFHDFKSSNMTNYFDCVPTEAWR